MFAKFGISSPFSKRKNKDIQQQTSTTISTPNNNLASVTHTNPVTGIPVKQQCVSNIPMPKKFQSFLPSLMTPPQVTTINSNYSSNSSCHSINSSIASSGSNIAISRNKQIKLNQNERNSDCSQNEFVSSESSSGISSGSNKTASNSSRSSSPTTSVESAATISISEMNTKQSGVKSLTQAKDNVAKQQQQLKKSGLPKGLTNKLTPSSSSNTTVPSQINSSKLQSISNSNIPNCNTDSKTTGAAIKKFGSSIKSSNIFGLNSKSTNNSQTNMPNLTQSVKDSSSNSLSSVSTSSIKSSNNTIKKTSTSNLSTTSSNSSCNIPKLTKINDIENSINITNNDSTTPSTVVNSSNNNIRKLQYPTFSPSSRIPNCTIVKKIETNNVKQPIAVKAANSSLNENEGNTQTMTSSCRQTALKPKIPVEGNLMSKSMNSNLPNLIYSKASTSIKSAKLSTNDTTLLKKPNLNQNDVKKNEKQLNTPCSSSSNIARVPPFKVDKNEEMTNKKDDTSTNSSEFNQEIHHLHNDESTPNYMSPNGYPSDKDLSTYARKIQKRFKDGIQAVKESMQFALSDEDFSDQHQNFNDNKNIYVSPNHQDDKKQVTYSPSSSTKQSPNNSIKSNSNKKIFNDLLVQTTNNSQMMQNFMTSSYSPKYQSVRSNTLDRKFRQSLQNDQQSSSSFKLFSSSLERNKHHQQQQLMMYENQNNDFMNKSQEYFSTNDQQKKSFISKKHLNQDIILENPNTISLSVSNDDLAKQLNSSQKPSYNEELLNKDKEIINLKLELEKARNRILTMTNQLNNNVHIVTTLEQNLSNLTLKTQTLSINVQRKEKTINELKSYLEILCSKYPKIFENEKITPLVRHNSTESMASLNSVYSQRSFQSTSEVEASSGKKKRSWLRSSFIKAFNRKKKQSSPPDSISETSSNKRFSDIDENQSNQLNGPYSLPTSPIHQQILNDNSLILKSNTKLTSTINDEDFEDMERKLREKESKLTDIQLEALASAHQLDQLKDECIKMKLEMSSLRDENIRLKMLVNENSPNNKSFSELSDIRNKSPNKSLDKLIKVINNETTSDKEPDRLIKRIEECKSMNNDIITQSFKDGAGKRVIVSIYYGDQKLKFDDILMDKDKQVIIGNLSINTRTKWDILDSVVKNLLKEYLVRLESKHSQQQILGLNVDSSLSHYYVGDMFRSKDVTQNPPDLLPYGYLVGNYTNITICLKDAEENCLDNLCFETLVPKNILQRYISLLTEYKHLLLCGQSGTCKTFIAKKIAEYLVKRQKNKNGVEYFNVENKSSKDLKQFLCNLVEKTVIPFVIILDNLQNISNISDTFNEFFNFKNTRKIECFVIGTVNHPNITSLNIHENFKWILCINQAEPVNNYLSRYLERCLVEYEVNTSNKNQELSLIIHWVPKLWQYLNKYIETYNSADVTLGPKLFSNVPMDVNEAKFWFIELWNHSLVPYIIETILEGVQAYGIELKWEDPKIWILDTCPWKLSDIEKNNLRSIRAADVGCEIENDKTNNEAAVQNFNKKNDIILNEGEDVNGLLLSTFTSPSKSNLSTKTLQNSSDNLINMLMRLQEVTMGNQSKRSVSNRIMNDKNLTINTSMILTMPQSVESAL